MEQKSQFGSNFGFLMAAVGSAVGLGNIWGFPYKMGKNGGFAFLLVYLLLVFFVGFIIMLAEMTLGRKTGKGVVESFKSLGKKYEWIGWLGVISPFLIMLFYCVLGGYCMKYAVANIGDFFGAGFGIGAAESGAYFNGFISNQLESTIYFLLFLGATMLIVLKGVSGGIEKFTTIAMPALFVMLLVVIIRSVTLPGAVAGLEFIFKPNFAPFAGGGWIKVIAIAGGQMFFSLSLGMGAMITYGAYLSKKENLVRNSILVPLADTTVALMAALAIMPAVFAMGLDPAGGPGLLFVTMQSVFKAMGGLGPFFGFLFYLLVFIAAITSSISLLEVVAAVLHDITQKRKMKVSKAMLTIYATIAIAAGGLIVALDGLGKTGMYQPFGFCWLEFFDLFSEGLMMPLGSLMLSVLFGWVFGVKALEEEITLNGNTFRSKKFVEFCLKFVTPIGMLIVLLGQLNDFFKLGLF